MLDLHRCLGSMPAIYDGPVVVDTGADINYMPAQLGKELLRKGAISSVHSETCAHGLWGPEIKLPLVKGDVAVEEGPVVRARFAVGFDNSGGGGEVLLSLRTASALGVGTFVRRLPGPGVGEGDVLQYLRTDPSSVKGVSAPSKLKQQRRRALSLAMDGTDREAFFQPTAALEKTLPCAVVQVVNGRFRLPQVGPTKLPKDEGSLTSFTDVRPCPRGIEDTITNIKAEAEESPFSGLEAPDISPQQREQLLSLLSEYSDVFALKRGDVVASTANVKHSV